MITAYTVALFKPDAVRRQLVGQIIAEIERAGLVVVSANIRTLNTERAAEFYSEHRGREYFPALVAFTASGPLYTVLLGGAEPFAVDVVPRWRELMGPSDATKRPPDSIRGRWAMECAPVENLVHGSDSREAARREATLLRGWGSL